MVISCAIVFVVWIGYPFVIWHLYPDLGHRGQFGDMFGAVNALFAGLAFAGIIWAIILQKNELELQREELAHTRKEIKGQKEQLHAQDQTLKKQNFENSFFQLLNSHNNIVSSLHIRGAGSSADFDGRGCFAKFRQDLWVKYQRVEDVDDAWDKFASEHQTRVDHYFRHLYNTIEFVDQQAILQQFEEKHGYVHLIRGQLSSDELQLLFYKCLSDGGGRFKRLVEKYSIFEGLNTDVLLDPKHKNKYAETAYGTTAS